MLRKKYSFVTCLRQLIFTSNVQTYSIWLNSFRGGFKDENDLGQFALENWPIVHFGP